MSGIVAIPEGDLDPADAANIGGLTFGDEDQEAPDGEGGQDDAKPIEEAKAEEQEDEKPDDEAAEAKTEDAPADDDVEQDFLEFEGEDGEPQRVELDAVWEAYNRVPELETQLADAQKATQALPAANQQAMAETLQARQQVINQIEQWQALSRPLEPNIEMLNANSPNYDPEGYAAQLEANKQFTQQHAEAERELAAQREKAQEEQRVLDDAYRAQEQEALKEFWPELVENDATKAEFFKNMEKEFGLKPEDIAPVHDHRLFRLAKDALAYRSSQEKAKAAVKIVRSKPKLVRGKARDPNPKGARRSAAITNLAKSGSDEAGTAAMAALFND